MLGSGLQLGRNRGEDRFYIPPHARKNYQSQHNGQLHVAQKDGALDGSTLGSENKIASTGSRQPDSRRLTEEPVKPLAVPTPDPVVSPLSNLELFLAAIRPSVLARNPKARWRTCAAEHRPYFLLGDLWESFKEWSAYGAGVPLILKESDSVVQYYVPYLSGIQIYGKTRRCSAKSRQLGEDSNFNNRHSSSDGSSDFEAFKCSRKHQNWNHLTSATSHRVDRLNLRNSHTMTIQEEFSSDESESGSSEGCLLFEYFERDPPYSREPLSNKISDLGRRFPDLNTLRSCDLLPSSWISVAWYPIYRIPTGPTLRDLDTRFLTFHSLHTPSRGGGEKESVENASRISLPAFGMASYKFKGAMWTRNGGCDSPLGSSLFQAADSWLRLLQVNHPDFLFFSRR